jgi:hypothetical protein
MTVRTLIRTAAGLTLTGTLLLAACQAPTPVAAGPTPTAPATPWPMPTIHGCATTDLTITVGQFSSAKFEEGATITLVSHTATLCSLSGYPLLRFDHNGQPLTVNATHPAAAPSEVTLGPGDGATVHLVWNKYESQGSVCDPVPTAVTVTPPGQVTGQTLTWAAAPGGSICGGTIQVAPVVHGG